ncbi:MAG: DedA family protein [Halobacteriaceae archaeon]
MGLAATLTARAAEAVTTYGYVALFVFVVLETAFVLHFAPSEVIIPLAAVPLISGPATFALFVAVSTVGAVLGSLLAYWLFGVYGETVLRRYGGIVDQSAIDRSRAWFRRYGTPLMFWGRLVPVLRTPISIPAGYAGMDQRRFVAYSAPGWLLYMALLARLGYAGDAGRSPAHVALDWLRHVWSSTPAVAAAVLVGLLAFGWRRWR